MARSFPANAHATTAGGQPIVYDVPAYTEVLWEDLVLHLHREKRYANAQDWSVLDHSVLLVRLAQIARVPDVICGYLAAHDFAEYVLKDLHPWVKDRMPGYRELEEKWSLHIHRSLGLIYPLPTRLKVLVKYFDKRGLTVEMRMLRDPRSHVTEERWGLASMAELQIAEQIAQVPTAPKGVLLRRMVLAARQAGNNIGRELHAAESALDEQLRDFDWRLRNSRARVSA